MEINKKTVILFICGPLLLFVLNKSVKYYFEDYKELAKLEDSIISTSDIKMSLREHYENTGKLPDNEKQVSYLLDQFPLPKHVSQLDYTNDQLTAKLDSSIFPENSKYVLIASYPDRFTLEWACFTNLESVKRKQTQRCRYRASVEE